MQIIGSVQIVTLLHLSYQPFELHCAFDLLVLLGFTVNFALFVRMRRGVSLLRERRGRCPSTLQAFDKGKACFRCRSNFSTKSKQA